MGRLTGFPRLYCDASFFVALFSKGDSLHKRAVLLFKEIIKEEIKLVTSWPVVGETMTVLRYHYGYRYALTFNNSLDLYHIITPTENQCHQAVSIFNLRSKSYAVSFVDALSFILITTELEDVPALSFDADFKALGLTVIH